MITTHNPSTCEYSYIFKTLQVKNNKTTEGEHKGINNNISDGRIKMRLLKYKFDAFL